jgi:enoyl-CoA hydratase/carnithine racemase
VSKLDDGQYHGDKMAYDLQTIKARMDSGVLFATFDNPPVNLIGPALVRDLVDLLNTLEHDEDVRVVVFASADEEFFLPHVDIVQVAEYTKETARIGGAVSGSLGGLLRRLSETRQVTIAKVEGFARGAGSELALACDMRFASRERAVFGQIEAGFGAVPGAGAMQHLTRLLGRGRAMKVILSSIFPEFAQLGDARLSRIAGDDGGVDPPDRNARNPIGVQVGLLSRATRTLSSRKG